MSKRVIFYNYTNTEIKKTLLRIGKTRFYQATSNIHHIESFKTSKFRLVYRNRTCSLQYNDGHKSYISIMLVEDHEMPAVGWMVKLDGW